MYVQENLHVYISPFTPLLLLFVLLCLFLLQKQSTQFHFALTIFFFGER